MAGKSAGKRPGARTLALLVVVVALLGANLWWFVLRTPEPPRPAFELGSTGGLTTAVDRTIAAAAPLFDPVHDGWTVNGAAVSDLPARLRKSAAGSNGDTAPAVDYLTVRLADDANSEQVRRALLSLARQHICFVALVDEAGLPTDGTLAQTPVHRIVTVRGNDGDVVACTPR
jgi:uncharacterized protein (UPF0248 family)